MELGKVPEADQNQMYVVAGKGRKREGKQTEICMMSAAHMSNANITHQPLIKTSNMATPNTRGCMQSLR